MSASVTRAMCSRPVLQPICAPLEQLTSSSFCLLAPYPFLLVPDRAVENSSTSSCQRRHTRPVDASTRSDLIREKFARGKITSTLWPLQRHFHIKEWRHGLNHLFAHSAIPAYREVSSVIHACRGTLRFTVPSVRRFTPCVVAGADGRARPAARHRFTRGTTIALVRDPASARPMGTGLPFL